MVWDGLRPDFALAETTPNVWPVAHNHAARNATCTVLVDLEDPIPPVISLERPELRDSAGCAISRQHRWSPRPRQDVVDLLDGPLQRGNARVMRGRTPAIATLLIVGRRACGG